MGMRDDVSELESKRSEFRVDVHHDFRHDDIDIHLRTRID